MKDNDDTNLVIVPGENLSHQEAIAKIPVDENTQGDAKSRTITEGTRYCYLTASP